MPVVVPSPEPPQPEPQDADDRFKASFWRDHGPVVPPGRISAFIDRFFGDARQAAP